MPDTVAKKLPLAFFIFNRTGEVHTVRYDESAKELPATCGGTFLANRGTIEREPIQITCEKCLDAYQERFKWTVEITVHPTWVMDGFDLTEARLRDMLGEHLSFANGDEYDGKILSAPDPDEIAMEQGYSSDKERKFRNEHGHTAEYKESE